MPYPPVIQFETRALEAEALARLAREKRAARASERPTRGLPRLMGRLPRLRTARAETARGRCAWR
jgi:hypothetical protein